MYGLSDSSFAMMTANQTKRKGTTMEHDIFEKFAQLTREEQENVMQITDALLESGAESGAAISDASCVLR